MLNKMRFSENNKIIHFVLDLFSYNVIHSND